MKSALDLPVEKRRLRLQIGRTRRRIDRRMRMLEREARRLIWWPTWVRRLPGQSLVGALGAGLTAAGLGSKRRLRALGRYLARHAGDQALSAAIRKFVDRWTRQPAQPDMSGQPPSGGGDHGQA